MSQSQSPIIRVMVALDLSHMDQLLVRYTQFLTQVLPEVQQVTFYHNIRFDHPEQATQLLSTLDRPLNEILQSKLEKLVGEAAIKVDHQVLIDTADDTSEAISRQVKHQGFDLVIFGKKISYDGSGLLIERVMYRSSAHLLVLPETAYHRLNRILAPTDFSRRSARVLQYGMALARMTGARISTQYVYAVPNVYFPYIPITDLRKEFVGDYVNKWKQFQKKHFKDQEVPEITFSFHADRSVAQMIYDHAIEEQVDLLLVPSETGLVRGIVVQLLKLDVHIPLLIL